MAYSTGNNKFYQLRFEHNNIINLFTLINRKRLQYINKIYVSSNTSFFLGKNGNIYVWL